MRADWIRLLALLAWGLTLAAGMRIPSAQRDLYHTDAQIQQIVDVLAIQNAQFNKRTCPETQLYNYLQIGKPGQGRLNAVLVCNIHARELIAAQICLNWLQNIQNDSFLLGNYYIRVFYIANHNRQAFYDHEEDCLRKNQNNADTNRNFPTDFNHWKADPSNQTYGGRTPFDQPLSQCLNQLFTEHKPDLFIDVHSGMNNTFYYQQGVNDQREVRIINEVSSQLCNSQLTITTLAKDGETINGHIFADLKVRLHVPFSFLIETYEGDGENCFRMFNPIGERKNEVILRYTKVIDYLFHRVAQLSSED